MAYQIQKLNRLIANNPALADVPFGIVRGRSITPREALALLQRGEAVSEVLLAMSSAGMDPIEQDWALAEDYYRKLLQLPGPHPKIYIIGSEMSLEDALLAVTLRDAAGQELLRSYQGLTRELARRMK